METRPRRINFDPLMDRFYEVTNSITELKSVADLLDSKEGRPARAEAVYSSYLDLVNRMTSLTAEELGIIYQANVTLATESNSGDTPRVSAHTLIEAWGKPHANLWSQIADCSTNVAASDPGDELTDSPAMTNLKKKFKHGDELKRQGKKFVDGDPESDAVIWEHIDLYGQMELFHFISAEYLQEYVADYIDDMQVDSKLIDLSKSKDFLIHALSDVLIIDHISGNNQFSEIYSIWSRPRSEGGIGWIAEKQLVAYQTALET
jgi:hypothetical protein